MRIKIFLAISFFILLMSHWNSYAQRFTLSGTVTDVFSDELLTGVNVHLQGENAGTVTNAYGYFALTLTADSYSVVFSFIGYRDTVVRLLVENDISLNMALYHKDMELREVVITDAREQKQNVERPQMGVIEVPVKTIKELPAVFGEKDLLKSIQLLPGVQSGSEASAGFYVRGGGPDQNQILLDEAVVYNPYHLAGFLSVFNMDAIKDVTLYKGGFPAQYGGRLSSVVDIKMKDGNKKSFHGEGGIGLITSRLTMEGPIIKEKSSFMVSGRVFYLPYIAKLLAPKSVREDMPVVTFYDLNGKVNYQFSDKDRIFLSGYVGNDLFEFRSIENDVFFRVPWGNRTGTLRWNHLFSKRLFANTTFVYSDYIFEFLQESEFRTYKLTSGIKDWNAKIDFDFFPAVRHQVKFGANYTYRNFIPSTVTGQSNDDDITNKNQRFVHESAIYLNDEFTASERWSFNFGLRLPHFLYKETQYFGAEPRVNAKYSINKNTSIKGSYTRMYQFVHLLSNSTATTPLDLWIPSSDVVKPQIADQISTGIFRNFKDDKYETSIELYYKNMQNQIEYKEGADVFFNDNVDEILTFGKGWSYGAEFFVQRKEGRFNGWIGYTLSWSNRRFPELNLGMTYPAKYDRRNDVSIVTNYRINDKWSVSAVFVYGSGHSITLPRGRYYVPVYGWFSQNTWYSDYETKNGYKLRSYNRLDIGLKRTKEHKRFITELRIDIYNVYSRRNPYFVFLAIEYDKRTNTERYVAKQVSLLPMIPSLSYNFKF